MSNIYADHIDFSTKRVGRSVETHLLDEWDFQENEIEMQFEIPG